MAAKTIKIDSPTGRYAAIAACLAALVCAFFVVKWTLGNTASTRADLPELAQVTTQLAPGDPQTHYAHAVLLERQFDIESLDASVAEYEKAAALSPSNYLYWLALGTARERSGDPVGGELALRRALELAPNYSRVRWALGNLLVRQGRIDEGFVEISKAADADKTYVLPGARLALQLFDGDLNGVRKAIGNSDVLNRSLPSILVGLKRYDEAFDALKALPPDDMKQAVNDFGDELASQFAAAHRYRYAVNVQFIHNGASVEQDKVTNGGFEDAIKPQNPGIFDWQIAAGQQPQIAPTNGQKHGGSVSLVLIFNSTNSGDFRTISQTVAVEPGREYDFEAYYRADLKTKVGFTWEIVDAANNTAIASTGSTAPSADWTRLQTRFRVPETTDGIVIRVDRVNCEGPLCPVAGNLWFDDISLKLIN